MKQQTFFLILTGILMLFFCPSFVHGQFLFGADIGNAYAPEDSPLSDTTVFESFVNLRVDSLSLETWASYNAGDSVSDYKELNIEAAYVDESAFSYFKAGVISYKFSDDSPSSTEIFAKLYSGPQDGFYIISGFYFDIDEFIDYYANLGAGYYRPIGFSAGFRAESVIGLAGASYSAINRGGLYDWVTTLSYEYGLTKEMTASLTLKYIDTLDERVYPVPEINLYILAGISYTF